MFEKEAEKALESIPLRSDIPFRNMIIKFLKSMYVWGAEFGYNKANEWHYVKDGDLPKDEDYKFCISSNGIYYIARYEELFVNWTNQEHKEVCCPYAWKEIVLPELKEISK